MKNKLALIVLIALGHSIYSQQENKPKLIVGVVIDQMRFEYLYRFQDNYTEKGFKKLIREGFNVKNTHYNYIPTATGPGHASIFTGTTPTNHGIVSNEWYSKKLKKTIYCAEDTTVQLVDNFIHESNDESIGFRSPLNLGTTTITDELKLFTNGRSRVIGISLKDRGAIFPAGHLADGAYWYNTTNNGHFITSSYYTKQLPEWLKSFNNQHKADSLLNLIWRPFLSIDQYKNSTSDNAPFEKIYKGKTNSTFPYDLKTLRQNNGDFALLSETPYGNTLLTQLALTTIKSERLGKNKSIDFLTISYSSTDYIGHNFGIRSKELEDTYIRMDREIEELLSGLDKVVGKGDYILFLTADHGASDHPAFLKNSRLPGNFYSINKIWKNLNEHLSQSFGQENYISYMDKTQIYLRDIETPKKQVILETVKYLKTLKGVKAAFAPVLSEISVENQDSSALINNSYHLKNSGDVILNFYGGWMETREFGTTHGNSYNSDTHVPLLWYGYNIPKGETVRLTTITQIVPTLSFLLNIPLANTSNKNPIEELFLN